MAYKKKKQLNLSLTRIDALTETQEKVLSCNKNMALMGCAGTGKTFLATFLAYKAMLREEYEKVLFIRSAVATRDIGFLPGTEKEKMAVYKTPYIEATKELFGRGDAWEILELQRRVSFEPTSFVRGRNLDDTFIIVDESQNMTFHELDSLVTRLGPNSKIIFCGDAAQADLPKNGISDFFNILDKMDEFSLFTFGLEDIVRSDLVKSYLTTKYHYYKR